MCIARYCLNVSFKVSAFAVRLWQFRLRIEKSPGSIFEAISRLSSLTYDVCLIFSKILFSLSV